MGALFSMGSLIAAQAGGVALGQRQAARSVEAVNRLADRDIASLQQTGRIEFISPPVGMPRRKRSFFFVLVKSVVYPFLACFVLGMVGSLLLTGMASDPLDLPERLAASAILGLVVGGAGAFFLAIPTILGLWASETRKRVEADGQAHLRSYWVMREEVREWLEEGSISMEQAYGRLASYRAPGQRQSLPPARVQQVTAPLSYDPYA